MRSVTSALGQEYSDYEIVVSDNSTNHETEQVFENFSNPKVRYIKRTTSVPASNHFELILNEVTSEFFVMFHDDDEMLPEFLSSVERVLSKDKDIIAVGANARLFKDGNFLKEPKVKKLPENVVYETKEELLWNYLVTSQVAPFPSYVYRRIVSEKLRISGYRVGKYWDVAFLMDILSLGKIAWVAKPLMIYHIHSSQDSVDTDFIARQNLIHHICTRTSIRKSSKELRAYRASSILGEIMSEMRRTMKYPHPERALKRYSTIARYCGISRLARLLVYPFYLRVRNWKSK